MKGDTKGNIHLRIEQNLLDKIDKQSSDLGLTRAGFCKMIIMNHLREIGAIRPSKQE